MNETKLPQIKHLSNGIFVPTEDMIIAIHEEIIRYRGRFGKDDTPAIQDSGLIGHLCDSLTDRMHKYSNDVVKNALYVSAETFYYIACQHPFHDGNKSTAYMTALLVLVTNLIMNKSGIPASEKNMQFEFRHKKEDIISAPKEAEEITRLAEKGQNEAETRVLIRGFLERHLTEAESGHQIDGLFRKLLETKKGVLEELASR